MNSVQLNAADEIYDMFTAVPQGSRRAIDTRSAMNKKIREECLALIKAFEVATQYDLSEIEEIVLKVNPSNQLSPSFHAVVHRAKAAMRDGDALTCYRNLKWLKENPLTLYSQDIWVGSPDGSPACYEGINHIHQDETLDVHGRRAEVFATAHADIEPYIKEVREAVGMVRQADPMMHEELVALISHITLFKSQAIMGGSLVRTFGGIFIASPDHDPIRGHAAYITHRGTPYFLEHLVHESSHNVLFGIMLFDPLVLNPVTEKFSAPLRTDLRPMYGIFHAAFVVSRMVRVFKLLVHQGLGEYSKLVDHFEPRLLNGIKVVSENGRLTTQGAKFFESMRETAFL